MIPFLGVSGLNIGGFDLSLEDLCYGAISKRFLNPLFQFILELLTRSIFLFTHVVNCTLVKKNK